MQPKENYVVFSWVRDRLFYIFTFYLYFNVNKITNEKLAKEAINIKNNEEYLQKLS